MKRHIHEDEKIKILKYKIAIKEKHIYICCLIIINQISKKILKTSFVISYNPAVFEININEEFNKIEQIIYKYKLEGNFLSDLSKIVCSKIYDYEEKIVEAIDNEKIEIIDELFLNILNCKDTKNIITENIFETYKNYETKNNNLNTKFNYAINTLQNEKFFIKTKPVLDNKRGISIDKLKTKNEILCKLSDKREIAKYIIKILFSESKEFYCKISEINTKDKKYYEIICNLTPVIFTRILLNRKQKIIARK